VLEWYLVPWSDWLDSASWLADELDKLELEGEDEDEGEVQEKRRRPSFSQSTCMGESPCGKQANFSELLFTGNRTVLSPFNMEVPVWIWDSCCCCCCCCCCCWPLTLAEGPMEREISSWKWACLWTTSRINLTKFGSTPLSASQA